MTEAKQTKVVIVEDEGLIAADIAGRLTAAGYSVPGIADTAVEALRVIRDTSPDLVLMDIRIKGNQDGIAVGARVREEFDVPVIYVTAFEDRNTLERASASNAYGYIKKPIAAAGLRGAIEVALAKHRQERTLREQRDWAIASFGAVPYAVLVTDNRGLLSYLNAAAEQLTGFDSAHALGRPSKDLLNLLYRESGEPADDFVAAAMDSGTTLPLPPDVCLVRDDDHTFPVEGSVAPKWRDGHIDGTVIALRDVSYAKFNEEQVRLDSTHEALRRFSDVMIEQLPDFKMAVWDTTILLDAVGRASPLRLSIENLDRTSMDAFAITCRLAAFAHVPDVRLRRVVLNDLVASLEPAWKQAAGNLVVRVDPEPLTVQADADELAKAFAAVLVYTRGRVRKGDPLVIDVSHPEMAQMSDWARVRFAYCAGPQDRAALDRAFEPSWGSDAASLDLAYTSIRSMGGLLTASLRRGNIAVFEIYLRRTSVAAAGQVLPSVDPNTIHLVNPDTPHAKSTEA